MQTCFPFRFAANLDFLFTEHPFEDRFAAAADAGFTAVECAIPYRLSATNLAERLQANRLQLVLFNAPAGDWAAGDRGLAALGGREAEFADGVERALEYAQASGARKVHVMAGRPAGDRAGAWTIYQQNLALAADRFAPHGIETLIEPINPRDMPGYLLADFPAAMAVLARLARPTLRLQFDVYHRQILCGDITTGLRDLFGAIAHVQIAAAPDRGEPDRGEIAYGHVFQTLAALGYQGALGCEYHPRAGTREGLAWAAPWRARSTGGEA